TRDEGTPSLVDVARVIALGRIGTTRCASWNQISNCLNGFGSASASWSEASSFRTGLDMGFFLLCAAIFYSNVDFSGLQHCFQINWIERNQKPALASVYENHGQIEDRFLGIDFQRLASAKRTGTANLIPSVLLGYGRIARHYTLDS